MLISVLYTSVFVAYTVRTTGIIIPGWFAVLSLNSLTNCIILTPLEPNAGPTGGAGVALPASICNLITLTTSFSAIMCTSF